MDDHELGILRTRLSVHAQYRWLGQIRVLCIHRHDNVREQLVQAFFMPNAEELSEQVRTGGLDFALLKPIDTQFLVSLRRINWSSLGNFFVALLLSILCRTTNRGIGNFILAGVALSGVRIDGSVDIV